MGGARGGGCRMSRTVYRFQVGQTADRFLLSNGAFKRAFDPTLLPTVATAAMDLLDATLYVDDRGNDRGVIRNGRMMGKEVCFDFWLD